MRSGIKHNLLYINWRKEAKRVYLHKDDFDNKLEYMKLNYSKAKTNTKTLDFINNTYTYSTKGYWKYIYCMENNEYTIYTSHLDDKVIDKCKEGKYLDEGLHSKQIINNLFKKYNNCTELKAFGYCDRNIIHNCIPKPVYYINESYSNKVLNHVSKVDYSSNYPSNLLGDLPDWHDHKVINGTVEPTEEYPFAYYIKSGHCAEYNVFDSHTWFASPLSHRLFKGSKIHGVYIPKINIINDEDDVTILCKKSKYTFDKVVEELYAKKGQTIEDVDVKKILNSFIGTMHRKDISNESYRLDHIAAIVIGRAAQKMIDNFKSLSALNIEILQIIVDGIIYKSPKEIGVKEKALGALVQEVTDAQFIMRGINQYMFFDKGKCIDEAHASFNDIKTDKLEDIKDWRKI